MSTLAFDMPRGSVARSSAISLKNVTVTYRAYSEKTSSVKEYALRLLKGLRPDRFETHDALADLSLTVEKGSVLAVIGSNGSGKSTLLKVLAQVLKPSSGKVTVIGNVASLIELGVAFDPELNAIENIYLHGSLHKKTRLQIEKSVERVLDFAELRNVANKPLKYYSSGMVARLGFSCAIDVDPDILLIDEILGVGDERFMKKCATVFEEFITRGKTIVMVSHDINVLQRYATHAVLMAAGRMVYYGDPVTAIERYRDPSYAPFLTPTS